MPKTVVVTGASRGLGLAITRILLETFSCNVVAMSRQSSTELDELQRKHSNLLHVQGDVSVDADNKIVVERAIDMFGSLEGLVHNAGMNNFARIVDTDLEILTKLYQTKVFSMFSLAKHAVPHLRTSKGRIVAVSSGSAGVHMSAKTAYGSSKAALNHIAATLAIEEPDITVMSIAPGMVDTEMQHDVRTKGKGILDDKDLQVYLDAQTNGDLKHPDIPGYAIASLATNGEKSLSGCCLAYRDVVGHQKP